MSINSDFAIRGYGEPSADLILFTFILELFKEGVLLLDEVDLLLHPLKSELNWPIGEKHPIDYTRSKKFGVGLRWDLQWHLIVSFRSWSMSHSRIN